MRRRWIIPIAIAVLVVTVVALLIRRSGQVQLVRASASDIKAITGPDLTWSCSAEGPYVETTAIKAISKMPGMNTADDIEISSKITPAEIQTIESTWPSVQSLTRKIRGKNLAPPPPPQEGYDSLGNQDFDWGMARRLIAKVIATHIRLAAYQRNESRCFAAAMAGREFQNFLWRSGPAGIIDYLIAMAVDSILDRAVEEAAESGKLSTEHLMALYEASPPANASDSAITSSIRFEWNYYTLPYFRALQSDPHFEKALRAALFDESDDPELAGNLDVPETLRLLAGLSRERIANARHGWKARDRRAVANYSRLTSRLPQPPAPQSRSWLQSWWDRMRYRALMNGLPNSLGIFLSAMEAGIETDVVSFRRRTENEAQRLVLLLSAYRQTHNGSLPANLADADPHLADRPMPMDWFSSGPFRYDRKRQIFWSIGPDGLDDGGTSPVHRSVEKDIVWPAAQ